MHSPSIPLIRLFSMALLALAPGLAAADSTERLFFTPQERAALDLQRNTGDGAVSVETVGAPLLGREITLNGIVKRSGGKSTVWVNGVPQGEVEPAYGPKILTRQARLPTVPVFVPALGKTANLKVGQTLDTGNGEIRENF